MSDSNERSFDYKELDDIIHARIRLAIMTILITRGKTDFKTLKKQTNTTDGNLSTHLRKLESAEYINVDKSFVERKPVTTYVVSEKGKKAYLEYIKKLEDLVKL
jgi:DNA-binding MarR family transcriptional regulator